MRFPPPQRDPVLELRLTGCLAIGLLLFAGCLLPFMLVDIAQTALTNLHLSGPSALLVLMGMLLGSPINLPVARIPLEHEIIEPVFGPLGGWVVFPQYQRVRHDLLVAVNVGGCVIPVLLAVWLFRFIARDSGMALGVTLLGIAANTAVCYRLARPIPKLGIALPFFVPAMTALLITWLSIPEHQYGALRAPVAFIIGITGPLIGADLLHWNQFKNIGAGTVSIGGAGTWDGIVISGLLAALFA